MEGILDFCQYVLFGLGFGCVYGLIGLAISLIFNASKYINFAVGEFCMLGGMGAYIFLSDVGIPYAASGVLVILLGAVAGLVVQKLVVQPLSARKATGLTLLIGTLAAAIMISEGVGLWISRERWPVPAILAGEPWNLGGLIVPPQHLFIILISVFITIGLWWFQRKTMLGRAIIAVGYDADLASLAGISVSKIRTIVIVMAAIIAAIAGLFVAPITFAYQAMGFSFLLYGFVAAIIGGMGNPFGAFCGGIVIGVASMLGSGYIAGRYPEAIVFGILMVMLAIRPTGLFGEFEER